MELDVEPVTCTLPGVPGAPGFPEPVVAVTEALCPDSPAVLKAVTVYVCVDPAARPDTVAEVPVTVARTVLPSYTRYSDTVPDDADQASEMALDVVPETCTPPG